MSVAFLTSCFAAVGVAPLDVAEHVPAAELDTHPVAAPPASEVSTIYAALSECQGSLPEKDRWRIAGVILHESQRYGYDPLFVQALIEVESTCSPTARGPRGAVGLIQVQPSTARAMAKEAGVRWQGKDMLTRPVFNVQLGLRYLSQLEQRFNDPYMAMAAYNLGPTRVARMSRQRARNWRYVRKVLDRYEDLIATHRFQRSAV